MKKTIWKFELIIGDSQEVKMPKGSEILSVQMQNGIPCLWALVIPDEKRTEIKKIETFGTGHPMMYDLGIVRLFIGTYQVKGLVFHVFEFKGL